MLDVEAATPGFYFANSFNSQHYDVGLISVGTSVDDFREYGIEGTVL